MKNKKELSGVIPIIPTPFTPEEEIDRSALENLIDFSVRCDVEAICLPAYASEFYKLTDEEKLEVVKIAVERSNGRVLVIGQANHPSLRVAIALAKAHIKAGANVISVAVPRIFSLPESSIKEYLSGFLKAIPSADVLIQDVNPNGPSISVELIKRLRDTHLNFKYLKLEEPLMGSKLEEIIRATDGTIGVFEGWGGLYMMELIPAGITGTMPGLAVADILQKVFNLRKDNKSEEAFKLFEGVMPQIFFSLQNMELFHYAEKELLVARGILKNTSIRRASYIPDVSTKRYIKEINTRILKLLKENGLS